MSGLCCWNLQNVHGSWISLNFGKPHLVIEEPKPTSSSERRRELRNATLRGDYWLWLELCHWNITFKNKDIANSESDKTEIRKALSVIDGQILNKIEITANPVTTNFFFDLGGIIHTHQYDEQDNDGLWHYYCDDGYVYSLLDNGKLEYGKGNESSPKQYPIKDIIIEL